MPRRKKTTERWLAAALRAKPTAPAPQPAPQELLPKIDFDDQMLSFEEVAHIARVSAATVRREIDRGRLPTVRFGRQTRVLLSALKKYISDQQTEQVTS